MNIKRRKATHFFISTFLIIVSALSFALRANAQTSVQSGSPAIKEYSKPAKFGFIKHLPDDFAKIGISPFRKRNLKGLSLVAASTAVLLWQDQNLLDGAKQLGKNLHLDPATDYCILVHAGNTKVIKTPKNLNTTLYQLGEGGSSMLVAGGLFIYGKLKKDNRALQTASDITETFISMGITTQLLKRSFGRQSPFMSTCSGGAWRPFPALKDYQQNTSNFDAFPSGHLATMMATVTVLASNYPEKKWIKPLGYSLIGLTGFAMMNTEVHWAGDYPLALALGYTAGKITVNRHKCKKIATTPSIE